MRSRIFKISNYRMFNYTSQLLFTQMKYQKPKRRVLCLFFRCFFYPFSTDNRERSFSSLSTANVLSALTIGTKIGSPSKSVFQLTSSPTNRSITFLLKLVHVYHGIYQRTATAKKHINLQSRKVHNVRAEFKQKL